MSHADLQAAQRTQWEEFYRLVHHHPLPQTYQELFTPDVDVRDLAGHWCGIKAWSAEERDAITPRGARLHRRRAGQQRVHRAGDRLLQPGNLA